MTGTHDAADTHAPGRIDLVRGVPTEEELAAVIAVVSEAYDAEASAQVADDRPEVSAWRLSARGLREPLRRDIGWGRFGA